MPIKIREQIRLIKIPYLPVTIILVLFPPACDIVTYRAARFVPANKNHNKTQMKQKTIVYLSTLQYITYSKNKTYVLTTLFQKLISWACITISLAR